MKAVTFDIECTANSKGKFKANWLDPDNRLLVLCASTLDLESGVRSADSWASPFRPDPLLRRLRAGAVQYVVGHNIKFDMHWLTRHAKMQGDWVHPNVIWWDTMHVEHLLNGGDKTKRLSLDTVAQRYAVGRKTLDLKEVLDAGYKVENIDPVILKEYCMNDVKMTEDIFLRQLVAVTRSNMVAHVHHQLRALRATWMIEHNGMHFNYDKARHGARATKDKLETAREKLQRMWLSNMSMLGLPDEVVNAEYNPNSGPMTSFLLFGGKLKVDGIERVVDDLGLPVRYKTGKRKGEIKTRKCKIEVSLPVDEARVKVCGIELNKLGYYPVDSKVLERMKTPFVRLLKEYRDLDKQLNTYYIGYMNLSRDGFLYPRINTVATPTGRYSMSDPNLQNVTRDRND